MPGMRSGGSRESAAADHWPPGRLAHLYLCLGLSTYGIAGLSGIERQRVTRLRGAHRKRIFVTLAPPAPHPLPLTSQCYMH
jgi:hypothetical protein